MYDMTCHTHRPQEQPAAEEELGGEVLQEGGTSVTFLGPALRGGDKWLGGELGADGNIYGVPGSAKTVVKVTVASQEVTEIGLSLRALSLSSALSRSPAPAISCSLVSRVLPSR